MLAVRTERMCLKAAGAEQHLFASCFTNRKIGEQDSRERAKQRVPLKASNQGQKEKEGFEAWLEVEGRAATKQRQCALVAGYQTARGSEPARATSLQGCMKNICIENKVLKRDKFGATLALEAENFGIQASPD